MSCKWPATSNRDCCPRRCPPTVGFARPAPASPPPRWAAIISTVRQIRPDLWTAVVADVSGKGVSSALLAGLLQGVFLMASANPADLEGMLASLNWFPAGAHPRRKIRDRFLLHFGQVRAAALRQRRPLRAVSGGRRRPPAQAAHFRDAGGNDRGCEHPDGGTASLRRAIKWSSIATA